MNTKIAIILFGLAVVAAADYGKLRMRSNPIPAPVNSYGQAVEEEVEEVTTSYIPAIKNVIRAPIRVTQESSYSSTGNRYTDQELVDEQNNNAQYSFGSAVDDGIQDSSQVRQETRNGLKVEGSYAYSDGYFKRTVNYVADENGYRVVNESVEPISETGPIVDLINGKAEVHTQIGGVDTQYTVSADEISSLRKVVKEAKA